MTWLLIGAIALAVLYFAGRWFVNAEPREIVRGLRWAGIAAGVAVMGFLAARGLWGAFMPLLFVGLYVLRRRARRAAYADADPGAYRARGPQVSRVETATLAMTLDHESGDLDGTVRAGTFRGTSLARLSYDDLIDLLTWCYANDEESAPLLETYLDRRFGTDWRDDREPGPDAGRQDAGGPAGPMTRDEAYAVLGLEPGASNAQIKDAHHRLMKRLHPDQGGSTFLATKINQAKDLLLRTR